ncbi:MAG TPA: 30S ribosome-binding factor RbfA [Cytophagales bacterium]|nr:30S ribosome-binding factor RbfA [Cytophagales bacterium]
MESKRQQKFSRLIQKELAEIFQRDVKSLFTNVFITVTHVAVSPDLGVAKVYISIMLAPNKEEVLEKVKLNIKLIRNSLAQKIRKEARVIPELIFYLDDSADYASKMDKLFNELDIPPRPDNEEKE